MVKAASSYRSTSATQLLRVSIFGQAETLLPPATDPAIHGKYVRVAHLLQIVGGQSRAKSAATIEHHWSIVVGNARLDIAFNDAFAQMHSAWQMIGSVLTLFPHVDKQKLFAAVELRFDIVDGGFADTFLSILDNFQKPR